MTKPDPHAGVTIHEAADALKVSEASVRNWIRAGYLNFDRGVGVCRESLEHFRTHVAGTEKLIQRANKSMVDGHDHRALASEITRALASGANPTELSNDYENGMSNSHRNREGIYYTPEEICDAMLSDLPKPGKSDKFCDPCCGTGNFALAALRRGYAPENIFGFDTDPIAVEIAKNRIRRETGVDPNNIKCADFLELSSSPSGTLDKFDAFATNPPWGKKIPKSEKEKYAGLFGTNRGLDTSALFYFACARALKPGGYLSLLMPESFFKIAAFRNARLHLLDHSLVSLRDFGKPFKSLVTRAQSFCAVKLPAAAGEVLCHSGSRVFGRAQSSFPSNPSHIINFEADSEDAAVLSKLFKSHHITLRGNARWGLGIITGNNGKFSRSRSGAGLMPVYKGPDIHRGRADPPTTFIPKNLSLYQQVAPTEMYNSSSKILYRFISSNLIFYHDEGKSFFLNSVNMIVPSPDFPIPNSTIAKLFNTDLFNWAYSRMFNTHKILRADLERMPLPVDFLRNNPDFSENQLLDYYELRKYEDGTFRA